MAGAEEAHVADDPDDGQRPVRADGFACGILGICEAQYADSFLVDHDILRLGLVCSTAIVGGTAIEHAPGQQARTVSFEEVGSDDFPDERRTVSGDTGDGYVLPVARTAAADDRVRQRCTADIR